MLTTNDEPLGDETTVQGLPEREIAETELVLLIDSRDMSCNASFDSPKTRRHGTSAASRRRLPSPLAMRSKSDVGPMSGSDMFTRPPPLIDERSSELIVTAANSGSSCDASNASKLTQLNNGCVDVGESDLLYVVAR